MRQDATGEAAEHHLAHTAVAVATHDQQVGIRGPGCGKQRLHRRTFIVLQALHAGFGVFPGQGVAKSLAGPFVGARVLDDRENDHLLAV